MPAVVSSANRDVRRCEVEDLVPVSKSGYAIKRWGGSKRRRDEGGVLTGSMLVTVPKEANLGTGGYGVVWRARHRNTKELFAVKNILPSKSTSRQYSAARERAVSERLLAAPHPCVVRVFSMREFETNGLTSLVMEFCPGGDLHDLITAGREAAKRKGTFYKVPEAAQEWIGQVFLGIEHLHRTDLLSRDIKPENVVFSSDGVAKLTDFGFGRVGAIAEQAQWSFGFPSGTPGYCAPEIMAQEPHDYRADLYSLAVLIWMLLTGGLTKTSKPRVPRSRPHFASDYKVFVDDWLLLRKCISEPEQNHSRPLPPVARNLLLGLAQREPVDRYGHQEIRDHEFMGALELPAPDAATSVVEAWLRRMRTSEARRASWFALHRAGRNLR